MKKDLLKKGISLFLCASIAVGCVSWCGLSAAALTLSDRLETGGDQAAVEREETPETYADVLLRYEQEGKTPAPADSEIVIKAADGYIGKKTVSAGTHHDRDEAVLFTEDTPHIDWDFQVTDAGIYRLDVAYVPGDDSVANIVRSLSIDGQLPYDECASVRFMRRFEDESAPKVNGIGDQLRPSVRQLYQWSETTLVDNRGVYEQPLLFYLEAGKHTLRLETVSQSVVLSTLTFRAPQELPTYAQVKQGYEEQGYAPAEKGVRFEAESAVLHKSSSTIRMLSNGDPAVSPRSLETVTMNCIGDTAWMQENASITWEFEVEKAGLYQLNLRMGQWYREGMPSYRQIAIDGQVPYKEFNNIAFTYSKKWRSQLLCDESGQPYAVYLTEGTHQLTMTAKQGEIRPLLHTITTDSETLSALLLQIVMIVGQNPDPNYDYHLERRIPGLMDTLGGLMDNMTTMMEQLKAIAGGKTPAMYNQLKELRSQLQDMAEDPYSIPAKTDDINNILTTYGDWISWLQQEPIILDYIEFLPYGQTVKNYQAGFFAKLETAFVQFIRSFRVDYSNVGSVSEGETVIKDTLDVWIARGKDWGTLIKQMADENFTPDSGVEINMHILPSGQLNAGSANALLLAVSSGMAPDVAMGTPAESVGEFAIRSAVADISQFPDYKEVAGWFREGLFVPVTYQNKVYGVPETMNFRVLLYRKDILSNLGIALPRTWDELYNQVIPVLYQNNMEFYFPNLLDIMLFQLGGEYYTPDGSASALDSPEAYRAFKEMCDMYTVYGVPVAANFFNRMRTGEMPIGIGDFAAYMQLLSAAPELDGRWGIAPLPGHMDANGKLNHSQGGAVLETDMIMQQSDKKEEAWRFLKWWMSKDVQVQFGNEIESINGIGARWNTANTAAFEAMPWDSEDLAVMRSALSQIDHVPPVLGGYFTTRHITNAFNRVVVSNGNVRDSLEQAVKDINKELRRKQQSYGVQ